MRKILFAAILLLVCSSLFGASPTTCPNPTLAVAGVPGEGCAGTVNFSSATYSTVSNDLKVMRYIDSSSPKLYSDCAGGTHLQTVTLSYPNVGTDGSNHPMVVTFKDVQVTAVDESINPTNESVQFKFAKWEIEYGGGSQTAGGNGTVRGSAVAGALNVAVVGGDGGSQPASHFEMSVRPGGVMTTSVQLLSPTPPPIHANALKLSQPMHTAAQPHLDNGVIEIRSTNGQVLGRYSFSGGLLNGSTLRSQKVSLTGTGSRLP